MLEVSYGTIYLVKNISWQVISLVILDDHVDQEDQPLIASQDALMNAQ